MEVSSSRLKLIMGSVIYIAMLILIYVVVISPRYAYQGFIYHQPTAIYAVISFFLAIIPSCWLPIQFHRPSQIVHWLLYLFVYIPAVIIPLFTLSMDPIKILIYSTVLFFSFWMMRLMQNLPLLIIPKVNLKQSHFTILVFLLSAIFYAKVFSVFGFHFNLVALDEVYDVRSEYKDQLQQSGKLVAYAILWQANVLNPYFIARGLVKKNLWLLFFGIFGQLLIYSTTGWKSVLFSSLLIIFLLMTLKSNGKKFGKIILFGFSTLMVVSFLQYVIFTSDFLASLFIRRMIITPGLLSGYYMEFFSSHPKAFLGHSILSHFSKYPYNYPPPNLIGYWYFGSPSTSANANIWADSFANFGLIGVLLFSIVASFVLWLFDSVSQFTDKKVASLLIGIPAFSLTNSALLTGLLTHGILLAILIVYLSPSKKTVQ